MSHREDWRAQYGSPEYRLYRTANRYGMRPPELLDMLKNQEFRCKICDHTIDTTTLKVDHDPSCCDHSSKRNTCGKCNRGLLCHRCNLAVGHIENALYDSIFDDVLTYLGHAKNDPDYDPNKKLRD